MLLCMVLDRLLPQVLPLLLILLVLMEGPMLPKPPAVGILLLRTVLLMLAVEVR